jgi:hypothetical protein
VGAAERVRARRCNAHHSRYPPPPPPPPTHTHTTTTTTTTVPDHWHQPRTALMCCVQVHHPWPSTARLQRSRRRAQGEVPCNRQRLVRSSRTSLMPRMVANFLTVSWGKAANCTHFQNGDACRIHMHAWSTQHEREVGGYLCECHTDSFCLQTETRGVCTHALTERTTGTRSGVLFV